MSLNDYIAVALSVVLVACGIWIGQLRAELYILRELTEQYKRHLDECAVMSRAGSQADGGEQG